MFLRVIFSPHVSLQVNAHAPVFIHQEFRVAWSIFIFIFIKNDSYLITAMY